jgi:HSP20 family protein
MFPTLWTSRAQPLERFRREFDTLFDRFFGGFPVPLDPELNQMQRWDFNVDDQDKEVVVRAELPGFGEKDLDVQLHDNMLTIRAEKQQENGEDRRSLSFHRTVTLPSGIDADKVTATYRNGVLEMHIPKTEQAKGRRIPIQGEQSTGHPLKGQPETAHGGKKKAS